MWLVNKMKIKKYALLCILSALYVPAGWAVDASFSVSGTNGTICVVAPAMANASTEDYGQMSAVGCGSPNNIAIGYYEKQGNYGETAGTYQKEYCKACATGSELKTESVTGRTTGCRLTYTVCVTSCDRCVPECGSYGNWATDPNDTKRQRRPKTRCDYNICSCVAGGYDYRCNSNYYGSGTSCSPCPANSTSSAGSTSSDQCKCAAGYYMSDGACQKCTDFSTSPAGSTSASACKCNANYFMEGGICHSCPPGSTSPAGSTSSSACSCPKDQYKSGDTCVSCPQNAVTDSGGQTSFSACECTSGYYMVYTDGNKTGGACEACPSSGNANVRAQSPQGSTAATACYIPAGGRGQGFSDLLGNLFYYNENCSYSEN